MNNEMGCGLHVVIIVSEGNSHVVLSVLLMHALDSPVNSMCNQ